MLKTDIPLETKITPFDFYLLRRPLLTIETVDDFLNSKDSIKWLRETFQNPILQEAIYVASPALYQRFELWLCGENIGEEKKLIQTLVKYLIRMSTRSTPYGLFAGCAVGEFAEQTLIKFDSNSPHYKHTRLDMNYLAEIVQDLSLNIDFVNKYHFYPNSSIYQVNNKFRYLFYEVINKTRHYSLVSVEASTMLSKVLQKAADGILFDNLVTFLLTKNINYEDAEAFIHQLIAEQILLSELELTTTGEEFQHVFAKKTNLQVLNNTINLLNKQDDSISKYLDAKQLVQESFTNLDEKDLFQTDLFFNTNTNTISSKSINQLSSTLEKALLALNPPYKNRTLDDFKERFYERYELQEMPLSEVLDAEFGIGYASDAHTSAGYQPLLDDLNLKPVDNSQMAWNTWKDFVLNKYTETLFKQQSELIVEEKNFDFLINNYSNTKHLPDTFYVLGSILANTEQDLDNGNFQFHFKNAFGPSGAKLLARFCHGNEKLSQKVEKIITFENDTNADIIFAEIVHLPEERTGNILMRPKFREYEIPYICQSASDQNHQLTLNDLMISIRNNKIFLRSRKYNKYVIPRLTNAHNYHNGLGIYKFLCDIQYEYGSLNSFWHWANLKQQVYLPRVRYKNIILSAAIWNINAENFQHLKNNSPAEFCQIIRTEFRLPQQIIISEFDNELHLDLEHNLCQEIFKTEFFKRKTIKLTEYLSTKSNCFISNNSQKFAHEIIIPFKTSDYLKNSVFPKTLVQKNDVQRSFNTTSEWLYVKIYCGEKTIDELLQNVIESFVEKAFKAKTIDSFFFVRYFDTGQHLRLRFHGNPATKFYDAILTKLLGLLKPYISTNQVLKIQTDTYHREIERYGADNISIVENIFSLNSRLVLQLLKQISGDEAEKLRWQFALKGVDLLLEDFGLTLAQKKNLLEDFQSKFFEEFKVDAEVKEQLNKKFRVEYNEIIDILESETFKYIAIFKKHSIRKIILEFQKTRQTASLHAILGDLIHLFLNRIFISQPRQHELVTYHYLARYYISKLHREPKSIKKRNIDSVNK